MGSLSNRNLIINFTSDVLNERNIDRMFFKNIYIYVCIIVIFYVSKTVVVNIFEIKFSTEQ